MAKRRDPNDPEVVAERIAEGRGLGRGSHYRPWITTHDFHSHGVRVRAWWAQTGRIHHLFSMLEYHLFLIFAADPTVLDIREQFPLLDFDRVATASNRVRQEARTSRAGSRGNVLTTDLVVTRKIAGSEFETPYNVKPKRRTETEAFRHRRRLEEIYWEGDDAQLEVLTEVNAPYNLVRSAEWILQATWPCFLDEMSEPRRLAVAAQLQTSCAKPHDNLAGIATEMDQYLGLEAGSSLDVARWMLAERHWIAVAGTAPFPSLPLQLTQST